MKGGRPTVYRKTFAEKAFRLYVAGAIDTKVAQALKIQPSTLYQWVKTKPEFAEARKKGKDIADDLMEESLFNRGRGMVLPDCHVSQHEGHVTVTPLKKHYPPDPVSMIFWLKNRRPDKWRDRADIHVSTEIAGVPEAVLEGLRKLTLDTMRNGH